MNPQSYKLYQKICSGVFCANQWVVKNYDNSLIGRTISYGAVQTLNWLPRLSYIDQHHQLYTPQKVKLSPYICLGATTLFFLYEIQATIAQKEKAQKHFEQIRL